MDNGPKTARDQRLHKLLWAAQVVLFILFMTSGILKLLLPMEQLIELLKWPGMVPDQLVRLNGLAEVLGALGLIVPGMTRIQPQLVSWAGYGLFFIMILAAGFHMSHTGFYMLPANIVIGGLAGFVGWGRGSQVPIEPMK